MVRGSFERHVLDHVAAALPWLRGVQHLGLAVEDPDASRREDLVPGEHVEIGVERSHVHREVSHGLGTVDQRACPHGVGHGHHLLRRCNCSQGVRHLGQGDHLGAGAQ